MSVIIDERNLVIFYRPLCFIKCWCCMHCGMLHNVSDMSVMWSFYHNSWQLVWVGTRDWDRAGGAGPVGQARAKGRARAMQMQHILVSCSLRAFTDLLCSLNGESTEGSRPAFTFEADFLDFRRSLRLRMTMNLAKLRR
jgi:hypothetical protein